MSTGLALHYVGFIARPSLSWGIYIPYGRACLQKDKNMVWTREIITYHLRNAPMIFIKQARTEPPFEHLKTSLNI